MKATTLQLGSVAPDAIGQDIRERRAEEKMRRRTEILNAAEAVVHEEGWDALTVVRVARRARLSRALVYVYFRHRNDLLLGIRERAMEFLGREMVLASSLGASGIERLGSVLEAVARFSYAEPIYFETLLRTEILSLEGASRGSGDFLGSRAEPCRRVLARVIATGQRDGSIDLGGADAGLIAGILWRFVYGLLQLAAGRRKRSGTAAVLDASVEQALALIRRALAGAPHDQSLVVSRA